MTLGCNYVNAGGMRTRCEVSAKYLFIDDEHVLVYRFCKNCFEHAVNKYLGNPITRDAPFAKLFINKRLNIKQKIKFLEKCHRLHYINHKEYFIMSILKS